jgi:hypothetical protein
VDGFHAQEGSELIDPHVLLEQSGVGVHQSGRPVNAGVIDQSMQPAHRFGGFDRGIPIFFFRDVEVDVDRAIA